MDAPDAAAQPDDHAEHDGSASAFAVDVQVPGQVTIAGELDAATAPLLDEALVSAAASLDGHAEVVLDCTGLEFIDSSGLSVLVTNHRRLSEAGRLLVIASPPAAARRLFEIAGLDEVLTIR